MNHISEMVNSPASEADIRNVEKQLHLEIPDVYKCFLLKTNGMVYDLCVLYGTGDIVDMKYAKAKKLIAKLTYPECVIFSEQS